MRINHKHARDPIKPLHVSLRQLQREGANVVVYSALGDCFMVFWKQGYLGRALLAYFATEW
jgi:hypothetical protein